MPKVSVIVPNYNHARFLQKRIDSILHQTFQDFEIILLDDASTDHSATIIESYSSHPKIRKIDCNAVNSGSTFKQWEKGFNYSKGDYIWIAESDDYANELFLENAISKLEEDSFIALYFSQSHKIDKTDNIVGDYISYTQQFPKYNWNENFKEQGLSFIRNTLSVKNVIVNASAVVFKKNAIDFPVNDLISFKKCGDWYLWIRIIKGGYVYYDARRLNFFREHADTTRHEVNWQSASLRTLEELGIKLYLSENLGMTWLLKEINTRLKQLEQNTQTPDLRLLKAMSEQFLPGRFNLQKVYIQRVINKLKFILRFGKQG